MYELEMHKNHGKKVVNGIDFDGKNCSAVKDFTVASTHFECEQGAENAFVKFRTREGILTIDKSLGYVLLVSCQLMQYELDVQ